MTSLNSASTSTLHDSLHKSDLIYRGSDAEYIISKSDRSSLDEKRYVEVALPILELQFPGNLATNKKLSADIITELNRNETEYIEKLLNNEGLTSQPIPKTLYDLFYIAFRIEQLAEILKKGKEKGTKDLKAIKEEILDCTARQAEALEAQQKGGLPEENLHLSKLDFKINEYVSGYLKQKGLQSVFCGQKLNQENITTLLDALWPAVSMQDMGEDLKEGINRVANGLCPFEKGKRQEELHIFCVSKILQGNPQNFRKLYERAIDSEFSQDPSYYTLYRLVETFSKQNTESMVDNTPTITAVGESLLSGAEGQSICDLKLSHPTRDYSQTVYRIPVPKEGIDYPEKRPDSLQLIPSNRSARLMKCRMDPSTFSQVHLPSMKKGESTEEPLNHHLKALTHFFGSENMIPFFKLGLPKEGDESCPLSFGGDDRRSSITTPNIGSNPEIRDWGWEDVTHFLFHW